MENSEKNFKEQVFDKVKQAKDTAPPEEAQNLLVDQDVENESKFITGEYDLVKFKEAVGKLPELGGVVMFETLPEFIQAVRQFGISVEEQNKILEHENAHALEALQRGYNIKYKIRFSRDVNKLFILKITRTKGVVAGVDVDYFNKNGREPQEDELRSDLIAMLSAPENLTNGELSQYDKTALGIRDKRF